MSNTYTESYTYTVVDVRKVMDQVRADLRMAAQSSGAITAAKADAYMADIGKFAEKKYLSNILIRHIGPNGETLRAAGYEISEDAATWTASRSGNMMWPAVPGSTIAILLTTTNAYANLGQSGQDAFDKTLNGAWPTNTETISLVHLSSSADRSYVSNAYGVKKTSYS